MLIDPQVNVINGRASVSYGSDNSLYPIFSMNALKDEEASITEGREIFKDAEWIDIHIVGDNLTKISRPVSAEDKTRFRDAYNAFKNQETSVNTGTPLTEWAVISKAVAMNLKSLNIHTVEQLASVSDGNLSWMGARELQNKAKNWLESAKEGAGFSKLEAENKDLKTQLEALKRQFDGFAEIKKAGKNGKNVSSTDTGS
jgi:hypothetical protein